MIDINKMRLLVQDYKLAGSPVFVQAADMNEILDRLEAAEKERDALRARIEAMEKQEPVAHVWRCDNGHIHGSCEREIPMGQPLYLTPYAQGESE